MPHRALAGSVRVYDVAAAPGRRLFAQNGALQIGTKFLEHIRPSLHANAESSGAHAFVQGATVVVPRGPQGSSHRGSEKAGHLRNIEHRMAFAILRKQGTAKGMPRTLPPSLSGFAEVTRIVAQSSGQTGMNGSLNGEPGPVVAHPLEITAGALTPLHRILTHMRNRRG